MINARLCTTGVIILLAGLASGCSQQPDIASMSRADQEQAAKADLSKMPASVKAMLAQQKLQMQRRTASTN